LELGGGPVAGATPTAGRIELKEIGSSEPVMTAAGDDGRFTVAVSPGTYEVSGFVPGYLDGKTPCRANSTVDVRESERADVTISCFRR
jgi:hypothetical protein